MRGSDAVRPDQRSEEVKAGGVTQDHAVDVAYQGARLPPPRHRRGRPARYHHQFYLPLQRCRDLSCRPVSGDRGQSVHHFLHGRDRERQVRFRMDRRQRFFRNCVGFDHGRMRFARTIVGAALLSAAGVVAPALSATEIPQGERRSGYSFMAPDTQAIQDDDTANPGMLWVLDGEKLWNNKAGAGGQACADCHHEAPVSMKGVAARYPAFDKTLGRPVNLEQRINLCRAEHQQATPLAYESHDLLALTAFVAQQSRGIEISAGSDG